MRLVDAIAEKEPKRRVLPDTRELIAEASELVREYPPKPDHLVVRVRAVGAAYRAEDRISTRMALCELAAMCEFLADDLKRQIEHVTR